MLIHLGCTLKGRSHSKVSWQCVFTRQASTINHKDPSIDWDDRQCLQNKWTLEEKGWQVEVSWKMTDFGVGIFSNQEIPADTVLRRGILQQNLMQFKTVDDVEYFCDNSPARWRYLADYLWGLYYDTDEKGYAKDPNSEMFVGMWIPGNALNHSRSPNTVYRFQDFTTMPSGALNLVALRDISSGDELYDDYRRHGKAPLWLKKMARERSLQLNFADCNNFVNEPFGES